MSGELVTYCLIGVSILFFIFLFVRELNKKNKIKKVYYDSGSIKMRREGLWKNGEFVSGKIIYYRVNGSISCIAEGGFNDWSLDSGMITVYNEDGSVCGVDEGVFCDNGLLNGKKIRNLESNSFVSIEGTFDSTFNNNNLINGTIDYYNEDGCLEYKHEGSFNNDNHLITGKKIIYGENNVVSLLEDGSFDDGIIVSGERTFYNHENYYKIIENGYFLNGYLDRGKQTYYESENIIGFEQEGEFDKNGDGFNNNLIRGKISYYDINEQNNIVEKSEEGYFCEYLKLKNGIRIIYRDDGSIDNTKEGEFFFSGDTGDVELLFGDSKLLSGVHNIYDKNNELVISNEVLRVVGKNIELEIINNSSVAITINKIKNEYTNEQFVSAIKLFLLHKNELAVKYSQGVVSLGYGKFDYSKSNKELNYFIQNVIGDELLLDNDFKIILVNIIERLLKDNVEITVDEDELNPENYEISIANKLKQYGFDTRLTQKTGDQGVDVIAIKNKKKVVIQCKLYSNSVGNSAVQEILGGKAFEGADYAVVVSNAAFTKSAKQLARSADVLLIHHDELEKINQMVSL